MTKYSILNIMGFAGVDSDFSMIGHLNPLSEHLLLHTGEVGAKAAITRTKNRESPMIRWIEPIIARRGFNKAVVALANKNARIGWLIVARDAHYDPGKAFAPA